MLLLLHTKLFCPVIYVKCISMFYERREVGEKKGEREGAEKEREGKGAEKEGVGKSRRRGKRNGASKEERG